MAAIAWWPDKLAPVNPQGPPPPGYYPPQPGYGLQPGYGAPPPQKKGKGCLIAALIVGGIALLLLVGVGIFFWWAAKTVGKVAVEGMNAPGTAEMRAAGCDVAMVMDMAKVSPTLFDGGHSTDGSPDIMVECTVSAGRTPPSCDDVAQAYVKGAGPARDEFSAEVQIQGKNQPSCEKYYDSSGKALRTVK